MKGFFLFIYFLMGFLFSPAQEIPSGLPDDIAREYRNLQKESLRLGDQIHEAYQSVDIEDFHFYFEQILLEVENTTYTLEYFRNSLNDYLKSNDSISSLSIILETVLTRTYVLDSYLIQMHKLAKNAAQSDDYNELQNILNQCNKAAEDFMTFLSELFKESK